MKEMLEEVRRDTKANSEFRLRALGAMTLVAFSSGLMGAGIASFVLF